MLPFCQFWKCPHFAEFKCKCSENSELFCNDHLNQHLRENSVRSHNLVNVFTSIEEEKSEACLNLLEDLIKENKMKKFELLKQLSELNSLVYEFLSSINNIDTQLKFYYSQLNKKKRMYYPESFNTILERESDPLKFLQNLEFHINDAKKLNSFKIKMKSLSSKIFSIAEKSHLSKSRNFLYSFQQNTNKLRIFDVENESLKTFEVQGLDDQGNLAAICDVDSNLIFHYGGNAKVLKGDTFFLNIEKMSVIFAESSMPLCYASCEKVKTEIFVFGGYNPRIIADSKYFDMKRYNWVFIAPLPTPQYLTSAISFGDDIIVSGNSAIYEYCISTNNYKSIDGEVGNEINKLLFIHKGNVMLISGNFLYSFEDSETAIWKNLGQIKGNSLVYNTGKVKIKNDFAYFTGVSGNIYRFNIKERILEVVNKIT